MAKRTSQETSVGTFVATKKGIIEVYSGSDARTAEVMLGDTFVATEEMSNGIYYLGKLKIKNSFKLSPGLSGKDVSKLQYGNENDIVYLLRKDNIDGNDNFFAQFKKIKKYEDGGMMAKGGELNGFKKGDKVILKFDIEYRKGNEEVLIVVGFEDEKLILEKLNKPKKYQMLSYVSPSDVVHYRGKLADGGNMNDCYCYEDGGNFEEFLNENEENDNWYDNNWFYGQYKDNKFTFQVENESGDFILEPMETTIYDMISRINKLKDGERAVFSNHESIERKQGNFIYDYGDGEGGGGKRKIVESKIKDIVIDGIRSDVRDYYQQMPVGSMYAKGGSMKVGDKKVYNKLVGRKGNDYYFLDYIFKHDEDFMGATGTIVTPVHSNYFEYATSRDGLAERYLDAMSESEWCNTLGLDEDDCTEEEIIDGIENLYRAGELQPFEECSSKEENQMREIAEFSDSNKYPLFEVIGGGRSFDADQKFDKVYDKTLLALIIKAESKKLANGGGVEMNNNTFVNILLNYGFVEKRSSYGVRHFYNKSKDFYASLDEKQRKLDIYKDDDMVVQGREYTGYSIQSVIDFLNKNGFESGHKYAKGGGVGKDKLKEFEIFKNGTQQGTVMAKNLKEAKDKVFAAYGEHREVYEIDTYAKGGGVGEKITQADLLNQNFKEAKEHIIEIHKRVKLKSGNELLLLKKESGWGIAKYNPKSKKELQWNEFTDKETANYWIDKVDVDKFANGGGVSSKQDKANKKLEKHIEYEFVNTDMGSGWAFSLDGFDLEMTYLDIFDADGIDDYDSLSKEDKKYYYEDWKDSLFESSYEQFKELAFKKYGNYYMEKGGNMNDNNPYICTYEIGGL